MATTKIKLNPDNNKVFHKTIRAVSTTFIIMHELVSNKQIKIIVNVNHILFYSIQFIDKEILLKFLKLNVKVSMTGVKFWITINVLSSEI